MLLFDYEHARRIPLLKPALGVAPVSIDGAALAKGFRYGVRSYAGLKEDVYAAGFRPDPSILAELGVGPEELLVTIRPPATEAHYHNPEAEALYVEVVELLGAADGVRMVILPRTAGAQREFVLRTWPRWCEERRIILPETALDGLNLVWHSDLVVSGGGTMNREAAALGVPVYSIFRGKLGAVDRYLARGGAADPDRDQRRCPVEDSRGEAAAERGCRRGRAAGAPPDSGRGARTDGAGGWTSITVAS